jgi:6-phosphogluconolactonase (cycloisomerase 2 family)
VLAAILLSASGPSKAHADTFLFATANVGNRVDGYSIESGGMLERLPHSSVRTGSEPDDAVVTPNGRVLYTSDVRGDSITGFHITPAGRLLPSKHLALRFVSAPQALASSANDRYLFAVAARSSKIVDFPLNPRSGDLVGRAARSSAKTGSDPVAVAVSSTGPFVYVVNYRSGTVSEFALNRKGILRYRHTIEVLSPDGRFAYVSDGLTDSITMLRIGSSGQLFGSSPAAVPSGINPLSLTLTQNGRYAYAVNYLSASISEYEVQPDGGLSAAATVSIPTLIAPAAVLAFDNTLYVAGSLGNLIQAYTINDTGLLASQTLPAAAVAKGPSSLAVDPNPPRLSPTSEP